MGSSASASTFSPSGAEQAFVVPAGVSSVDVEAVGGSGAPFGSGGGRGGAASGTLSVTPGEILYLEVGGNGSVSGGGFNGGGAGGGDPFSPGGAAGALATWAQRFSAAPG